ncbi:hypothetical protein ACFYRC_36310 [Streptomyces sp. NPDC005279]|uniref:hypothetical protein n=1 Tax=Streptomyces sp. NPDC005279 TaxID=3364712 RepID=UPI003685DE24
MSCANDNLCQVTVNCPPGKVVTGGGIRSNTLGNGLVLMDTFPASDTSWRANLENDTGVTITITAWAVCANAT